MRIRTLTISLVGCAAVSVAAPAIASASTVHDFLPPAVANAIPQFVADAVQPLLPPAPVMRAGTIQDFLPREIVGLIPTGSADALGPMLPPVAAPPLAAPAPAPAPAPQAAPAPQTPRPQVGYKNCTEARNAGVTPIYRGQAGYAPHLDRDNDGIACE
ncbi:excalibur calcium-binding domain-containing protein [Prescottella equi]|uniref:Secreted calcium-binding protein n=1 Tax=Rhodococcus hoagii (strain 103S) TaxID=685727 RepID=A0A3S5Y525_RHOH1|nr:excalibur calcium-binding domain-containing protein [Prescottella equi]MDP8016138.1 excalibur calcium-binding domain-containing protein [Prescottella equi]UNQ36552.1 excalibur calcium-binding domain-containing protein [Prescottella equi]GBF17334.1 excalibur calcium-binding domain protein [Rhodococcus sp. Br-6]CBH47643.1 putative secreted calcium-binding protein [Prescottella equi 103S]